MCAQAGTLEFRGYDGATGFIRAYGADEVVGATEDEVEIQPGFLDAGEDLRHRMDRRAAFKAKTLVVFSWPGIAE